MNTSIQTFIRSSLITKAFKPLKNSSFFFKRHYHGPLLFKSIDDLSHQTDVPGMIDIEQLQLLAEEGEIETVYLAFTDHMGRQMGKRYDVDFFLESGFNGSNACQYLFTVDMAFKIIPGFEYTNWY